MEYLKKTKIITTLGPATDSIEKIEELYNNGANIIRINYSHSNYDYFSEIINNVKKLNEQGKTNLSILTDTKGPEIRTKSIDEKIVLDKGDIFIFTTISNENNITNNDNKKVIVCDYEYIVSDLEVGHVIDIDTGLLKALVIEKRPGELICEALNAHKIGSKRHVNLPGIKIHLPGITESDKQDLKFAIDKGTDFIALSFVRNKNNILELREFLKEIEAPENIQIISKIENQESLDNLDEIIEESDGIMIARGDLGAEVPFETLPIIQKLIGDKCKEAGKFFIVATQMLESMIDNPIPTRAEVTDIFNAVMQKADCTMLSGETAAGKYPIEAVQVMRNVINYSESQIIHKHKHFKKNLGENEHKKIMIKNAIITAENLNSKALIIFTKSTSNAKLTAAFRPNLPVYSFTYSDSLSKKTNVLFGIQSFVIEETTNKEELEKAIAILKEKGLLNKGDEIVTVNGMYIGEERVPNIHVLKVS
ncbi:MAG: pyruvate kinase [Candidatus Gracilibacteria bacterium]|nr:pyruvate kinase [Candidatus Gracilibacteria bacterium]